MLGHTAQNNDAFVAKAEVSKPWQSEVLQELIRRRRLCDIPSERTKISKLIQKESRKQMRKYYNERTTDILQEFSDLGRMSTCFETPVVHSENTERICPDVFANLLQEVYGKY